MHHWHVLKDFDQASKAAADFIAARLSECGLNGKDCHVILPGGNTPATCLGLLAQASLNWSSIHWYPGDERCYPVGHEERNDTMLAKNFWSHLSTDNVQHNVHAMPAELGPEQAAMQYARQIEQVNSFDLAFLGMGEDGHTASLFPDNPALDLTNRVVPVFESPKPPFERVSFGLRALRECGSRVVLAAGKGKADIIGKIKRGSCLPINDIGPIEWFIDEEANAASFDEI